MGRSHGGWYLQQLVKLGASRYLPGLSDTFMVWDPDMIPLWPVTVFGERSATNGGKRKVFRQVGGYVIRSYEVSLFLVIFGYFWLFLVIFGYFWLFLVIFGYFWLFLVIFGYFWLFLVIFGYFWLFLVIFGYFSRMGMGNVNDVSCFVSHRNLTRL